LRFVELGQFLFKSIVNNFMLEINAFSDETSTLHKHRLSKPSFDALLDKSKESKFGCLKTTLEKQHSQYFSGNHNRERTSNVPRKGSNIQTGAKFLAKFLRPHDKKTDIPNWGKIFVKTFAISRNVPHWGNF
jgi:hypothetical protein